MQLSRYFSLEEMTFSQTAARRGIANQPNDKQRAALTALCKHVLDPLREHLGSPVRISSGLRVPAVNRLVGSDDSSQHVLGEAADLIVPGYTVRQVVDTIQALRLPFDQLIDEFSSWTHVSYGPRNRRQVLKARTVGGKTRYTPL